MDNMKRIPPGVRRTRKTVEVDIATYERLRRYCRRHGLHSWRVLHEALVQWLETHDKEQEG